MLNYSNLINYHINYNIYIQDEYYINIISDTNLKTVIIKNIINKSKYKDNKIIDKVKVNDYIHIECNDTNFIIKNKNE
jgi:hypothetical protein